MIMAQFFKVSPQKSNNVKKTQQKIEKEVLISTLDHHGCGVALIDNKPLFIKRVLLDEVVNVVITESKKRFSKGDVSAFIKESPERISPQCPHYQECGGCHLQHCNVETQRAIKSTGLKSLFKRFTKQDVANLEPSLVGAPWQYRRTARFGVQFNRKSKKVEMGFRRSGTNSLIDQKHCPVLLPELESLILPVKVLLNQLPSKQQLGHVELISSDQGAVVLLRHMKKLTEKDCSLILDFSKEYKLHFFLQKSKYDITAISGQSNLSYELNFPERAVNTTFNFDVTDFLQVNADINQKMVQQAMRWLALNSDDIVLDLFCGLGNFTLPISHQVKKIIGIEGMQSMVDRATNNAALNQIGNAFFYQADLSEKKSKSEWQKEKFTKVLLDPARQGAFECMAFISKLKPSHIVFVACDPVTLARDSKVLLEKGYRLEKLGLIDMFPQTEHMESMALFVIK
jgi:23S rRNA (uracil1939-C5)-methyltransferase